MKKVLVNCSHNETSGGGGYYAYQVIKAISSFCKIYLTNEPNKLRFIEHPELKFDYLPFNDEDVDWFLDVNHFANTSFKKAKNIKIVFFPKAYSKDNGINYNKIVTISDFSKKWIKRLWNEQSLICEPYSKPLLPGKKQKNSIIYVGNFCPPEENGHTKGQDVLIKTFKNLPEGWELNLVGNPISYDFVEHLKRESVGYNINFHLSIAESEKETLLKKSEFFWSANGFGSPSIGGSEHYGIAAEEAIKSGCLTYVHNSGGSKSFCESWDFPEELLWMTKNRVPNKVNNSFQTPQKMIEFWKKVIN